MEVPPRVRVIIDGDDQGVDEIEPGYLARFEVDGHEIEIEVNY